jgi:hypothetical protein
MLNMASKTSLVTMLRFSGAGAGEASAAPRRKKRNDVTFMTTEQEKSSRGNSKLIIAIDILKLGCWRYLLSSPGPTTGLYK